MRLLFVALMALPFLCSSSAHAAVASPLRVEAMSTHASSISEAAYRHGHHRRARQHRRRRHHR